MNRGLMLYIRHREASEYERYEEQCDPRNHEEKQEIAIEHHRVVECLNAIDHLAVIETVSES